MKKYLLALVVVLTGCVAAMAGDNYKIVEGSVAPMKEGGEASLTINMDDCKFDNKMPLRKDGRFAGVDSQIPNFESEFVREFNEHSKKFKMTESDKAEYHFDLNVKNLDVFVNVFSFKGGVGCKIWGTLTVTKGGETVCVAELKEWESSGMTYDVALEETFETFAKAFAKRVNKGK